MIKINKIHQTNKQQYKDSMNLGVSSLRRQDWHNHIQINNKKKKTQINKIIDERESITDT